MDKKFFFMAGLPRSGSTLLSAILNQNPDMYSGPSSPVVPSMLALEQSLANDELFMAYPKPDVGRYMIGSILPNFYVDVKEPYIIDKNRSWVNRIEYIRGYFGIDKPKIICPVRSIDEILVSFIQMIEKQPIASNGKINFIDDMLVKSNQLITTENRCNVISDPELGILGQSYQGIKKAVVEGNEGCLHFVEYRDLIENPTETMNAVYQFLEMDTYQHDFDNIENVHREQDSQVYGVDNMHAVRSTLEATVRKTPSEILPPSIFQQCQGVEFWRDVDKSDEVNNDSEQSTDDGQETNFIGA